MLPQVKIDFDLIPDGLPWIDIRPEIEAYFIERGEVLRDGLPEIVMYLSENLSALLDDDLALSLHLSGRVELIVALGSGLEQTFVDRLRELIAPTPAEVGAWGHGSSYLQRPVYSADNFHKLLRNKRGDIVVGFSAEVRGILHIAAFLFLKKDGGGVMYVCNDDESVIFEKHKEE